LKNLRQFVAQVQNETNHSHSLGSDGDVSLLIDDASEFDLTRRNHTTSDVAGDVTLASSSSSRDDGLVILLSRRWGRNRGRRLLNEREIIDELNRRFGTSRVVLYPGRTDLGRSTVRDMRHLDLSTARRLFAAARLVVGVHGGAFYNVVMAPVNCNVVEIMPLVESGGSDRSVPPGLAHTIVWRMSSALGHSYWRLYETTSSPHGDVTLPVERLRAVLDSL
jgi:hypothetical protein